MLSHEPGSGSKLEWLPSFAATWCRYERRDRLLAYLGSAAKDRCQAARVGRPGKTQPARFRSRDFLSLSRRDFLRIDVRRIGSSRLQYSRRPSPFRRGPAPFRDKDCRRPDRRKEIFKRNRLIGRMSQAYITCTKHDAGHTAGVHEMT